MYIRFWLCFLPRSTVSTSLSCLQEQLQNSEVSQKQSSENSYLSVHWLCYFCTVNLCSFMDHCRSFLVSSISSPTKYLNTQLFPIYGMCEDSQVNLLCGWYWIWIIFSWYGGEVMSINDSGWTWTVLFAVLKENTCKIFTMVFIHFNTHMTYWMRTRISNIHDNSWTFNKHLGLTNSPRCCAKPPTVRSALHMVQFSYNKKSLHWLLSFFPQSWWKQARKWGHCCSYCCPAGV